MSDMTPEGTAYRRWLGRDAPAEVENTKTIESTFSAGYEAGFAAAQARIETLTTAARAVLAREDRTIARWHSSGDHSTPQDLIDLRAALDGASEASSTSQGDAGQGE